MNVIDFEVKLFDTTSLAADGSNIPRRSCEEYLQSADYSVIIRDKVAVGGLSHKDRRLKPELKGLVGMDDQVFINDNALFYITKLYFKEGDNFLYARARTFDPDLFAGDRANNIRNLIGLLESGVRMPVSVVIQALWSKRGTAEKIIRIKGFDFTQNPSFKGAGDIKVFSEIVGNVTLSDDIKEFSASVEAGDILAQTRVFSSDSDVSIVSESVIGNNIFSDILNKSNNSVFSYIDIVSHYGQGSEQEKWARQYQGSLIHRDQLYSDEPSDEFVNDPWYAELRKYVSDGKVDELQVLYRGNRDHLINILKSIPESEPNRSDLIRTRLDQFFRVEPRQFSLDPNTVMDRVRTANQPRYTKFQRTLKAYKVYWENNKLTDSQKYKTKLLLLQDINLLIKDVLKELYKGQTLNSLYGLAQYGDEVKSAGMTLSNTYRKVLISEKLLKFIPKALYAEWSMDIRQFYQVIMIYVFGEGLPQVETSLIDVVR